MKILISKQSKLFYSLKIISNNRRIKKFQSYVEVSETASHGHGLGPGRPQGGSLHRKRRGWIQGTFRVCLGGTKEIPLCQGHPDAGARDPGTGSGSQQRLLPLRSRRGHSNDRLHRRQHQNRLKEDHDECTDKETTLPVPKR